MLLEELSAAARVLDRLVRRGTCFASLSGVRHAASAFENRTLGGLLVRLAGAPRCGNLMGASFKPVVVFRDRSRLERMGSSGGI